MPEAPSPRPAVVRPASPEEYAEAGRIAESAYRAGGHLEEDHGYDLVLRDAAARALPGPLLVAEQDGRVVGTATITPHGSRYAEMCGPGETEFRFLAVAPEAWGGGIARALVDAVVAHARDAGSSAVVCCVIDWNEPGHRLYTGYGFTRVGHRDWDPVPGIHLLAYELPL